ncbi:hypothetical protein SAMN05421820_103675 [Pedobacter steynii]|uniref:Uncharacterized protein n=1 Tax=Pedobacter steynii TaxID=430522 RepID=A0A1G9SQR2_9SPHI|nr:DUF6266 family protein [Pedobacter steynii]NQX37350.1 hypothetical protein [Pedobacter steynii]SDM37687.1 hypothetical protein SAMN05421820_103675 [Pedobacter steynii]
MARITKGLLGGFSGKVGTVVGYNLYGIDRMRSLPDRTAPPTENELKNRSRFKLMQEVLNSIKGLIQVGFKDYWTISGGMRGALSYNRKFALKTDEEGDYIDPASFRISGGSLAGLTAAAVVQENEEVLRFNWDPSLVEGGASYDQVMLLAIDMQGRKASYQSTGNFRSMGTDVLVLSEDLIGKEVDIYVGVVAKDRCSQSESQYLGRMKLQGPEPVLTGESETAELIAELAAKGFQAIDSSETGKLVKKNHVVMDIRPFVNPLYDRSMAPVLVRKHIS